MTGREGGGKRIRGISGGGINGLYSAIMKIELPFDIIFFICYLINMASE